MKKQFLDNPPARIANDVKRLVVSCAQADTVRALASAKKLAILLQKEAASIKKIAAPAFQGQVRYGKLLDVPSHDVPMDPADKHLMRGPSQSNGADNSQDKSAGNKSAGDNSRGTSAADKSAPAS